LLSKRGTRADPGLAAALLQSRQRGVSVGNEPHRATSVALPDQRQQAVAGGAGVVTDDDQADAIGAELLHDSTGQARTEVVELGRQLLGPQQYAIGAEEAGVANHIGRV